MEESIMNLVGNLGFPIAITVYNMVTMNKTIQANTSAVESLSALVQRLFDRVEHMDGGSHE